MVSGKNDQKEADKEKKTKGAVKKNGSSML
jgi:hypothetical protein